MYPNQQYLPLGNFNQNVAQLQQQHPEKVGQKVDFNTFNSDYFFNQIKYIDQLPENDTILLIKNHIDIIVERTLSDDKSMGPILCHPKFVEAYCKAIRIIPIDYDRRLFVNKLTYEYSIIKNSNPDILRKFKDISNYVNGDVINKLMGIGLNRKIASDLVACRYSSRHENVNIQRLNFNMCRYNYEIFTDQMIIWIYEQLFDRVGELFITTMLEVYTDKELDEISCDFRDIYGNISLAILVILNNMPLVDIRTILIKYNDRYISWAKKRYASGEYDIRPRFTLRALSYDYERIIKVVDQLIAEGYDIQ